MLDLSASFCLLPFHSLYDFPLSDERHDKHSGFQCGRSFSTDFPRTRLGYGRQRHRKIRFRLNTVVYYKNKRSFSRTCALRLKVKGVASRQLSQSRQSPHSTRVCRESIDSSPTPQSFSSQIYSQNLSQSSSASSGRRSASEYPPPHFVRRQPRIQVSSLLSESYTPTYQLEVVQQPQKTAEFRNASLSRLPLTPPLVARLVVRDPSGNPVIPQAELPFLIAHLSLYTDNGLTRMDVGYTMGQGPPLLYGNLVSSLDILEDLQGNTGLFFIFPDVSIRWCGRFQLGISLLRISSTDSSGNISLAEQGTVLAETRTLPFDVLPQDQYTAVPQTRLTQSFLRQGARMFSFLPQSNP
ncbi:uncharacterized protein BT62DRAFT_322737 [Guyanagaster necrorhizus]|uniref:Velvet domain-containing protein n=1 Tax=Guyanagaster necrorhizus TaxID=856835 RepID=A0A9P7VPJ9_9AGAR|nr:uncharacterized protein BT62DRAFT_322737 [Guyanagaster necrorhizus MCA 3950]KAG7443654.1 hypothetical protein BT62DRAFT_322737 [Guyanagaster necrorhizus MCA 3950]